MRSSIKAICLLAILLVNGGLASCAAKGDADWNDMPVYPGAASSIVRTWPMPFGKQSWGQVEWHYFHAGAKENLAPVTSFYHSKMIDRGWREMDGGEQVDAETEKALFDVYGRLSLYTLNTDLLESWHFYSRGNPEERVAVWIGLTEPSAATSKTYVVLMKATR